MLNDGTVSKLIDKNTSIPASMVKTYTNSHDNQDAIAVQIYQGDPPLRNGEIMASECVKIAEFDLNGFAGKKQGQASVEVTFEMDSNGILNVKAIDKTKGSGGNV